MQAVRKADDPAILAEVYRLFREYFRHAERKRRWLIEEDIPWDQCNRSLNPILGDIVETFCSVELYLPDYLSKLIPQVRADRGRAWFLANWGYEESKHSLALNDWLLKSGQRTDEQMADLNVQVFAQEWELPHDSACGMLCYAMVQELATWVHYGNLKRIVAEQGGDPALDKTLSLIGIDERSHFDFFRRVVLLYLDQDREGTLEQLRQVIGTFRMPAYELLVDSRSRAAAIRSLRIFDEQVFFVQVIKPLLTGLGLTKADLKRRPVRCAT